MHMSMSMPMSMCAANAEGEGLDGWIREMIPLADADSRLTWALGGLEQDMYGRTVHETAKVSMVSEVSPQTRFVGHAHQYLRRMQASVDRFRSDPDGRSPVHRQNERHSAQTSASLLTSNILELTHFKASTSKRMTLRPSLPSRTRRCQWEKRRFCSDRSVQGGRWTQTKIKSGAKTGIDG